MDSEIIKSIKDDWKNIIGIEQPSEEMMLAAIENDWKSIEYLENCFIDILICLY